MNRLLSARLHPALRSALAFLRPQVGTPMNTLLNTIEIDGNLIPASALIPALTQLNNFNIADTAVNFQSTAGAAVTVANVASLYQKLTNGGAVVVTLDAAYNLANNLQNPFNGQSGMFSIFSSGAGTVATPTLTDTTITLSGTTSIAAGLARQYQWLITQLATTVGASMTVGTTFTSLTQVGATNGYTIALATNAIVPVVGQVVFLNVTAGTLPSGWYPITFVTSATSFRVALPLASPAWTMTAGSLPGTTTVPVSQYQTGLTGIFSPLMTVTAMQAVAAVV